MTEDKKSIDNKAQELSELERKLRKKLSLILSQISTSKVSRKRDERKKSKLNSAIDN